MKKTFLVVFLLGLAILLFLAFYFSKSKKTPGPINDDCLKTCSDKSVVTCDEDCLFPSPTSMTGAGKEEEECLSKGGEWKIAGLALTGRCFMKMNDAGKVCQGSDECEGSCLALEDAKPGEQAVGQCSEYDLTLGCHSLIENGKVMPAICAD